MCYSPCFFHATQTTFAKPRLLQCRTCGSRAFHILDCCRNPDYTPVTTLHVGQGFRQQWGRVKAMVRRRWPQRRQRVEQTRSLEALDAWERRAITVVSPANTLAPR